MNNSPLFTSFFTPDKIYRDFAKKLEKSLTDLEVDFEILQLTPKGLTSNSWIRTAALKSEFILEQIQKHKRTICWVDVDCYVLRLPDFLFNFDHDFAVAPRKGWDWFGGQMVFSPSKQTLDMLETWVSICNQYPLIWDQLSLSYAYFMTNAESPINTLFIPDEYMAKFRTITMARFAKLTRKNLCFAHFSASLLSDKRRKNGNEDRQQEFTAKNTPLWWRTAMIKENFFRLSERQKSELGMNQAFQ